MFRNVWFALLAPVLAFVQVSTGSSVGTSPRSMRHLSRMRSRDQPDHRRRSIPLASEGVGARHKRLSLEQ